MIEGTHPNIQAQHTEDMYSRFQDHLAPQKAGALLEGLKKSMSEKSLYGFARSAWDVLEPGRTFQDNWHIGAICEHLEAFHMRQIKRLIINVPFRTMKSILCSVCFPTWVWGPRNDPSHQFLFASHAEKLSTRDAQKSRYLIQSEWYQRNWGDRFKFRPDQNQKGRYQNDKNGHRLSYGLLAGMTGEGGDTLFVDDPHDRDQAFSDAERGAALEAFDEKLMTRLNDPANGGVGIIMQRLHEDDLTGHLLAEIGGYEHLMIPMRFEPARKCYTSIGWQDPRTEPGELMWPDRFPLEVVEALEVSLGDYGTAGQFQQNPSPSEGGMLKYEWFETWPDDKPLPDFIYILQSWDTAMDEKSVMKNKKGQPDFNACVTWGVFADPVEQDGIMTENYSLFLLDMFETQEDYTTVREEAKRLDNDLEPHLIVIEKKANGPALSADLRNMVKATVMLYDPRIDKVGRTRIVAPYVKACRVCIPDRAWARKVVEQHCKFPNAKWDDVHDASIQGLMFLKDRFWMIHPDDIIADNDEDDPDQRRYRMNRRKYYG